MEPEAKFDPLSPSLADVLKKCSSDRWSGDKEDVIVAVRAKQTDIPLKLGLGASDNRQAYQGAALRPGVDLTRESVKSFFGTIGYNVTPNLSVNLGINQDQRHADVAGYSYASTRFSLSVSQAF